MTSHHPGGWLIAVRSLILVAVAFALIVSLEVGPAERLFRASAQAQNFPVPAGSWAGKVRSGPGQNYAQVGSLNEGEDVLLLENTGIMMNGYPWFRIRFRNNREGYKWGGILCAKKVPVDGVYKQCPGFEQTVGGGQQPADATTTTVTYSCEEGIPLIVRYVNTDQSSTAYFSHDSFPEVELPEVVSGSGAKYSNGHYTLWTKGPEARLEWDGTVSVCEE